MVRARRAGEKICPRCGMPYSYLDIDKRASNTYVYAIHYYYEGGKRKKRKCYLGPLESYIYVTKLHTDIVNPEGLVLEGALSTTRAVRYIEALTAYFENRGKESLTDEELRALRKLVYTLLRVLGEKPY